MFVPKGNYREVVSKIRPVIQNPRIFFHIDGFEMWMHWVYIELYSWSWHCAWRGHLCFRKIDHETYTVSWEVRTHPIFQTDKQTKASSDLKFWISSCHACTVQYPVSLRDGLWSCSISEQPCLHIKSRWKRKRRSPVIRILPRSQRWFCVVPPVAHCGTHSPLFVMPPTVLQLFHWSETTQGGFRVREAVPVSGWSPPVPWWGAALAVWVLVSLGPGRGRPVRLRKCLPLRGETMERAGVPACHCCKSRTRKVAIDQSAALIPGLSSDCNAARLCSRTALRYRLWGIKELTQTWCDYTFFYSAFLHWLDDLSPRRRRVNNTSTAQTKSQTEATGETHWRYKTSTASECSHALTSGFGNLNRLGDGVQALVDADVALAEAPKTREEPPQRPQAHSVHLTRNQRPNRDVMWLHLFFYCVFFHWLDDLSSQRRRVNNTGETLPPSVQTSWPSSASMLAEVAMEAQLPVLALTSPEESARLAVPCVVCWRHLGRTSRKQETGNLETSFFPREYISACFTATSQQTRQRFLAAPSNSAPLARTLFWERTTAPNWKHLAVPHTGERVAVTRVEAHTHTRHTWHTQERFSKNCQ